MLMNEGLVKSIKEQYPKGTRVELTKMDDIQAPPIGTKGTVIGVDDIGSIMVNWDNGSSLSVVYGEDSCRKLKAVTVICYGKTQVWDSREEAKAFYLDAIANSDGSEKERYTNIFLDLESKMEVCCDER